MPLPLLTARRLVRLPTVWGWLLLLVSMVAASWTAASRVYPFLAVTELAPGARTLVVEGWIDAAELEDVAPFLRGHRYERVLVTGGPVLAWADTQVLVSSAERAAVYLRRHGVDAPPVIAVPAPASAQDRTFLSAVMVREWAGREHVALDAIDVFSAGAHARRTRTLYRLALGPRSEVGIVATPPREFDAARWWRSSAAAKSVLGETIGLAWTTCCFWPPEPGSHEERWAAPPSASTPPH